ncbi:MAG: hypothetical protein RBR52_00015 [Thiomonas sp.]|uniref:hypothetical protein n=1 Tax=Thiomonas sp. TaxID=2047785 RepID=UPI002A3628CA|nr:hypothetical protein [Thiomonas sp.]MDY0328863.1 hypothetical protein [Thiomonas sp.]
MKTSFAFRPFVIAAVLAIVTAFAVHSARAQAPLSLFGAPLKGASRDTLRAALLKAGLTPTRVDNNYFCDQYDVSGKLKGATQLTVCYTEDDNTFASAEYTFPAFMDTGLVKRVIDMVQVKYGRPTSLSGNYGLGGVTAKWRQPQGMQVLVTRGWPDTTTYLDLTDVANDRKMHAQMRADEAARQKQQAQSQSKAF